MPDTAGAAIMVLSIVGAWIFTLTALRAWDTLVIQFWAAVVFLVVAGSLWFETTLDSDSR